MHLAMTDEHLTAPFDAQHGPEVLEQIAETINEMMWAGETSHGEEPEDGYVWISDQQMVDACNHIAAGVFWWGGIEYSFEVENGNWNGFVFRTLSADGPVPEIKIHRTVWDVCPLSLPDIETAQQARFFLAKWDHARGWDEIRKILGSYAYDRMFQPGAKIEGYYRDKLARRGLKACSKEAADELRALIVRQFGLEIEGAAQ